MLICKLDMDDGTARIAHSKKFDGDIPRNCDADEVDIVQYSRLLEPLNIPALYLRNYAEKH